MPVKAPFRFARINRWIYEPPWADLVSHDVPFADGLSGEAEVEITARSSILAGGDRRKATQENAGEVQPFKLPDGGYAIPGSALQGMARAILEVAGFGRLGSRVADLKLGIRDLSGTPTAREHYQNRLSTSQRGHVTVHSKAGWLMKSPDGSSCILPCKYARIHLDDILSFKQALLGGAAPPAQGVLYHQSNARERYDWFTHGLSGGRAALAARFDIDNPKLHRHNNGRITIRYSRCRHAATGGKPGTLVLTGKPQSGMGPGRKKFEFVFHDPCRDVAVAADLAGALSVERDVWDAFLFMHEEQPGRDANPNWDFWRSEFDRRCPVPIFYWEDGVRVTTLGTAFAFKAAHRKSARDLLAHSCTGHLDPVETMKLDLAHLVFGVATEHGAGRGLKRRARFGLARADGDPQPCIPEHPSILLGPKPGYAGLYIRQRHDNQPIPNGEPLATYTPMNRSDEPHLYLPELSGVKIWPARPARNAGRFSPGPIPGDLAGNRRVQTRLVTLPPGTVFRSRLTFHNLRPVELGALLWTLSFGDEAAFGDDANRVTKRHRLGMGKPLGLGEVTVRVTGLKTEAACSASSPATHEITADDLVRTFEHYMKSSAAYGPDWSASKQVAALLRAATPTGTTASDLEYMTLAQYQTAKGNRNANAEYLPDYAPSGSHEKPPPIAGATAGVNPRGSTSSQTCAWVDETIESLKQEIRERDGSKILRGQPLARKWQAIADPSLKRAALQDIVARWKERDWWDDPPRGAARKAKAIYCETEHTQTPSAANGLALPPEVD